MLRATEFIWQELQPDLALLFSSVMAVPFYRGLGWEVISWARFCWEQPDIGAINYTEVIPEAPAMVLIPQPGAKLPGRELSTLCGLPW